MTPTNYWRSYAKQNAKYERFGDRLFLRALIESARPAIVSGSPDMVDPEPIRRAYRVFFERVGKAHIEWERKQWAKKKSGVPDLISKEDERGEPKVATPTPQRRRTGVIPDLISSFSLSFRSARWLQRLRQLINGLDVASRIQNVTETTKKEVRKLLSQYSQEEVRTRKVAARLMKDFSGKLSSARARLIARTETTYVANEAAKQSAEETGLDLVKGWIATLDNRTRDAHRAMHGKDPIDAHEKFIVGGVAMDKPGDPAGGAANVCNCRCIVYYLPKDDAEL